MIKKQVTLLGAKQLNFTSDKGEEIKGTSVYYYDHNESGDENKVGFMPNKVWLSYDHLEGFVGLQYPLIADLHFDIDLAKQKLKPKHFELLKETSNAK